MGVGSGGPHEASRWLNLKTCCLSGVVDGAQRLLNQDCRALECMDMATVLVDGPLEKPSALGLSAALLAFG